MTSSPSGLAPDVATLLAREGVSGAERDVAHNGYSGSRITSIEDAGTRWLLKRLRYADDWLMRVTNDVDGREASFAASSLLVRLPPAVTVATHGGARDGDGFALLMRDVSASLVPDKGTLSEASVGVILAGVASLHATFEGTALDAAVSFATLESRVTMLSPAVGQMLIEEGRDFGLSRGWDAFARIAPPDAVGLTERLFADPAPLVSLLRSLPQTLLHGDLKLANIAIEPTGRLCLLDWALVCHGPAAVDLAWYLAVNASRIGLPLPAIVDLYIAERTDASSAERWRRERDAIMLCGLLLYGWGKALDAESGPGDELRWWCEGAVNAAESLNE